MMMLKQRLAIVCAIVILAISPAVAQEAPPQPVRFSGSDGVELTYAAPWSRVASTDEEYSLLIRRPTEEGRYASFGYRWVDLSMVDEADRNAAYLARDTVALSRKQQPDSIVTDITPVRIGGLQGYYFELDRTRPDGNVLRSQNWTVTFNEATFLLTGSADPADALGRKAIHELMESAGFMEEYRQPDGQCVTFSDAATSLAFDYPSHWHDDPPARGHLAQWTAYTDQGDPLMSFRVLHQTLTEDQRQTALAVRQVADQLVAIHGGTAGQARAVQAGGVDGHERELTGFPPEAGFSKVHVRILQRDRDI